MAPSTAPRRAGRRLANLLALLALVLATGATAHAKDYAVDTTVDDPLLTDCDPDAADDCSLRGALLDAASQAEASTIVLPAGAYTLTSRATCVFTTTQFGLNSEPNTTTLCLPGRVTIVGAGAANTVIDGNGTDRVIVVGNAGPVRIEGVTIRNGRQASGGFIGGGGGVNNCGDLTLVDCVVTANFSQVSGGGIHSSGPLTMRRCKLDANTGREGGGLFASSFHIPVDTTILDSSITSNQAFGAQGGGLFLYHGNQGGSTTIRGSTIADNEATNLGGGGVFDAGLFGTIAVTNSTISGNRAGWCCGGGFGQGGRSTVHFRNVTVTGNRSRDPTGTRGGAGGIAKDESGVFTLANTIVAGNEAPEFAPDCYDGGRASTFGSDGYNLIGDDGGAHDSGTYCDRTGGVGSDTVGEDPQLGALTDNGGQTNTHAPEAGSPAIDTGDPTGCKDESGTVLEGDQRGEPRPEDGDGDGEARCDKGAVEGGGGFGAEGIDPDHAGNGGTVCALIHGSGFSDGVSVALEKDGRAPIPGMMVKADESGGSIATGFDLRGHAPGTYDLVLTHPDGSRSAVPDAFVVESGGAPELWAEVIGPTAVRRARPFRFFFFYGNRGNVDALGVPIQIAWPPGMTVERRFAVAPPPANPDQAFTEWERISPVVDARPFTEFQVNQLILPIVPAGFTGSLELRVIVPPDFTGPWGTIVPMIGKPYAQPDGSDADSDVDVDPAYVAAQVANASTYARDVLQVSEPLDQAFATQYTTDQLERIVAEGTRAWIDELGRGGGGGSGSDGGGGGASGSAGDPVCADACIGIDTPTATIDHGGEPVPPLPVGAPGPGCIGNCTTGCPGGWPGGRQCACPWNWDIRFPFDPNDKVGGIMGSGYISGDEPLRYAIYFENDPVLANAPAQEVIVEDQLDVSVLDLDSFSFGPIAFGDRQVIPVSGAKDFETEVDLRPEENLIVRVRASLDVATGLVTWRFTSLDPDTGELPEDADAGFLPPNLTPPEGDGTVTFTVRYDESLPSGTEICNDAEIFFDENPAIVTPEWCNTLDDDDPVSAVNALAAVQTTADFPVAWSGTDVGSGIIEFDVFVSVDGGEFLPFAAGTSASSDTFYGTPGRTYAFYSVARDDASNVEEAPAAPDTVTTVDLCPDDPAKVAPLVCGCGTAEADSDGDGSPDCIDAESVHDLAVVGLKAAKRASLAARAPSAPRTATVILQNRSPHPEVIPDAATLAALVSVELESLSGVACGPAPLVTLRPPRARAFPITVKSKRKLKVSFDVVIGCAVDPAKGAGHEDYRVTARVDHDALGSTDSHPENDVCPRRVTAPGEVDPHPDGTILDKGCGAKLPDKTFGGPVLIDAVEK